MAKQELVYSYFSVEKLYCVIIWKIIIDQVPLDELIVLSKELIKFSNDDASKLGVEVWFNEDNSIVVYPDNGMVNIICFGQCENTPEVIEKLKKSGKQLKSFNDYGKID